MTWRNCSLRWRHAPCGTATCRRCLSLPAEPSAIPTCCLWCMTTRLVSTCLERSRELGYTAVVLSSLPDQRAAQRIYTRFGFRRTPELDWSPMPDVDLIAFRLDL